MRKNGGQFTAEGRRKRGRKKGGKEGDGEEVLQNGELTREMVSHCVELRPDGSDHVLSNLSSPPGLDAVPLSETREEEEEEGERS